jgi:hypothetical protein
MRRNRVKRVDKFFLLVFTNLFYVISSVIYAYSLYIFGNYLEKVNTIGLHSFHADKR